MRRTVLSVVVFCVGIGTLDAGGLADGVRGQWNGAFVVTKVESYSRCFGGYFDNRIEAPRVDAREARRFEPGEIGRVDRVRVRGRRVELFVTYGASTLWPRRHGPFTLYDRHQCRVELEVTMPRDAIRSRDLDRVERHLAKVLHRFDSVDEAVQSPDWNGRTSEAYPAGYEETLARYREWWGAWPESYEGMGRDRFDAISDDSRAIWAAANGR